MIVQEVLTANNIESLVQCLQNISSRPASSIYVYVQDSPNYVTTVQRLLDAGLSPNYCPGWSETPLLTDAIESDNHDLLRILLAAGAWDTVDELKESSTNHFPIASQASPSTIQLLLRQEAKGCEPLRLHVAALDGRTTEVRTLLDQGYDANFIPTTKEVKIIGEVLGTPLHYAAENRHILVTQLLLENGADATLKDRTGRSVLEKSMRDGAVWADLEDLLAQRGE